MRPRSDGRGTARSSAMVMSAVSSVRTFGVLVTMMPRAIAAATSMLSTPLPKFAISLRRMSGWLSSSAVISSETVGTRMSAVRIASASWSGVIGVSSRLSRVSKSSRMRVSVLSGSFRVTTTRGFFLPATILRRPFDVERRHRFRTVWSGRSVHINRACSKVEIRCRSGELFAAFQALGLWSLSSRRPRQDKNPKGRGWSPKPSQGS